jgi:hypothetical protein
LVYSGSRIIASIDEWTAILLLRVRSFTIILISLVRTLIDDALLVWIVGPFVAG